MEKIQRTVFYDRHVALGAQMVEFGGFEMPLQYPSGIIREHLTTRKAAGLFDLSHMGRFRFRGRGVPAFLQHVLSNDVAALKVGRSQYTILPNPQGGAVDDAYLYRFSENEFLLVVNAANRSGDWTYLQSAARDFGRIRSADLTGPQAMLSLQGPISESLLDQVLTSGRLPQPPKNSLGVVGVGTAEVWVARTGYTGEPLGFELFMAREEALDVWDLLVARGARPIGLGARDTLRLEAGLPLYGHELGLDAQGRDIPLLALGPARFAVSLSPAKGNFVGRSALEKQSQALEKIGRRDYRALEALPRMIRPVALLDKGVARPGNTVYQQDRPVGTITSGTMVPFWRGEDRRGIFKPTAESGLRAIGLALIDSSLEEGHDIQIDIRGRKSAAVVVPRHLKSRPGPFARAVLYQH